MVYRFRIVLDNDTEEDIFRDIEIREVATLEDLHNSIIQAFGFDGMEMASFYLSDEQWNQGEEISLFDTSEGYESVRLMADTLINEVSDKEKTNLIYVYDFLNMWTFYVELAEIVEATEGTSYPNLMFAQGQVPVEAPQKLFEAENIFEDYNEFDDDFDVDDYESLDFDENWN